MPPSAAATAGPAWTVAYAAEFITAAGIPCTAAQLAGLLANLPGIHPVGEAPSGPRGGRGKAMYLVSDLMDVATANARWLTPQAAAGPGRARQPA